jgi:hypothetical protein
MDLAVIRATVYLPVAVQVQLFPINLATTQVCFLLRHQLKLYLCPTDLAVIRATLRLPLTVQVQLLPINLATTQV